MSTEIHIDELILRGIPPEQAAQVADAMRVRLSELATHRIDPLRAADVRAYRGRQIHAESVEQLGTAAADAVWNAVNGGAG